MLQPGELGGGFHMIRSLEIKRYKGFGDLTLSGLRRINVILGPNASGKTALLEAILVATSATPETSVRIRGFRGREGSFQTSRETITEALWAELFHNFENEPIVLSARGDERGDRTIEISRIDAVSIVSTEGLSRGGELGIRFTLKRPGHLDFEIVPRLLPQGIESGMWPGESLSPHFIPARTNISEEETARCLSALRVENKSSVFERVIRAEFDFLSDLSTEDVYGTSAIWAQVKGVPQKIPIAAISGGINHIIGMLVRAASQEKSILLIDEIENGVFHDRYESMWRALHALAKDNETQIFATTHSLEVVQALARALSNAAEDVAFIRTSRGKKGIEVEQMDASVMFGAVEIGDPR